jgi:hypothetical protein
LLCRGYGLWDRQLKVDYHFTGLELLRRLLMDLILALLLHMELLLEDLIEIVVLLL